MKITRPVIHLFDDHSETEADAPAEFILPADLSGLDDDALGALEAEAVSAFDAIRAGRLDADALQSLSDLTAAIEAIREETGIRAEAAALALATAEDLAARVHVPDPEVTEEAPEATGDATEAEVVAESLEAEAPEAETTEVAEPEMVAASAQPAPRPRPIRVPLSAIRAQAPDPQVEAGAGDLVITAAADLPGLSPGARIGDVDTLARAMHGRARHLGEGSKAPVASLTTRSDFVIGKRTSAAEALDLIMAATNPQSLVASGGWCSPSQILMDLFSIEANGGLWDVPTLTVERGGLEYVQDGGPSIADVFATQNYAWLWTEAQDIAAAGNPHVDPDDDETKPFITVPCPTWTEERLDLHGIWVQHGNLADQAFPELTSRFLSLVLSAHLHTKNARHLLAAEVLADAVTMGAQTAGATVNLLSATELQAADVRDKFRMDENVLLEAVYPSWVRGVIRSDLAKRQGVDLLNVTNAQINGWFNTRGVRPQFVQDWQSLQSGPDVLGSPDGFIEANPTSVKFLLYPAGTYVVGNGPTIDLGVGRDSTLNATNDHTLAYTEEARLVAKVGHEARVVTVPIEADGATHGGLTNTEAVNTY